MSVPATTRLGPGGEFDLIRRFLDAAGARPAGGPGVLVGPGDDAAVLEAGRLAVSTDLTIEDVHYRRDWITPDEIGYRSAAAALSDLAAMAARPIGLLASLGVAEADARDGLAARVMAGVVEAATAAGAALLGGDLTGSPGPIVLDVVVLGEADLAALRRAARPGDELWVTGRLGAAAAAVLAWREHREPDAAARAAFARPAPRLAEARWLAARGLVHALIDLSDGLAGDAGHIAAASGVQCVIEAELVPVHEAANREAARSGERRPGAAAGAALRLALTGGDDYELLFAAPPAAAERAAPAFQAEFGLPLTRVGHVREGAGTVLRDAAGERAAEPGFSHFGP